jgi:hypothetical protein
MWKPSALVAIVIVVVILIVAPAFWAQSNSPASSLPAGSMQAKATTACLECHDAYIIEQQRLSKATWTKEVDKMTKWGALVDAADRDALIEYLSVNFGTDKAPYVPARSAAPKGKK